MDKLDTRVAERGSLRAETAAQVDGRVVARCPSSEIAPEPVQRFDRLMRETVTMGEAPLRKARLQAVVERIEVGTNVIRIIGDKASLEAVVAETPDVRRSIRKWRARKDSNL